MLPVYRLLLLLYTALPATTAVAQFAPLLRLKSNLPADTAANSDGTRTVTYSLNAATGQDATIYLNDDQGRSNAGNYGSEAVLGTRCRSGSYIHRTFMQFDVPFTGMASITKATLSLKASGNAGGGTLQVFKVTAPWSQSTITANAQPAIDATVVTSTYASTSGLWYKWDITSLVSSWQTGSATNNGLSMRMVCGGWDIVYFHSSESVSPSNRPLLTIVYTPTP